MMMVMDTKASVGPGQRVAVVTGAAAGIGAASARALHDAGYAVALLDVSADGVSAVAAALGGPVLPLRCDVASPDSVVAAFDAVRSAYGRIDVLHSNAGIFLGHGVGLDGPLESLDLATWRRTLDVNLTGSFLCVQAALASLLERGGSIVFTASVAGALLGSAAPAYAASKAGVVGFMRSLVLTYAGRGVRVNAICPGPVHTDMSAQVRSDPALTARLIANIPAGRIADPADIANLVVFLASDAGSYLNGVVLPMEGGLVLN